MELGQLAHGNPVGEYELEEWQDALVMYLLDEIERVYWNTKQDEWNRYDDPEIPGVTFRAYYWGEDPIEAAAPNLQFASDPQTIRWYKHPGRSMTADHYLTNEGWIMWFNDALKIIRKADIETV